MADRSLLDRLEALLKAATPLPWECATGEIEDWWGPYCANAPECVVIPTGRPRNPVCSTNDDGLATEEEVANARLIAAAVNALPVLLRAARALEEIAGRGHVNCIQQYGRDACDCGKSEAVKILRELEMPDVAPTSPTGGAR